MTVMTRAAVSFSFSFVFTRNLYNTHYITYFMAHSFYAFLVPPIVVGVLMTCQSLDPENKTIAFFQMYFQEKKHSLIFGPIRQHIIFIVQHNFLIFLYGLALFWVNLDYLMLTKNL